MINVKRSSLLTFTFYILPFAVSAFILFVPSSCQKEKTLYTENAEIGAGGWMYHDSIRFAFNVVDTATIYNLNLQVTHADDYAWQNLYVRIRTGFPGDSVKTDILSLELTNGSGVWMGNCRSDQCRLTIPLQQHLLFPAPGPYSLTFSQHMRKEPVPGILGLRLTVVEAERQNGRMAER